MEQGSTVINNGTMDHYDVIMDHWYNNGLTWSNIENCDATMMTMDLCVVTMENCDITMEDCDVTMGIVIYQWSSGM